MAEQTKITTGLGKAELRRVLVCGYDLNKELVGKITFTDMVSLMLRGRLPSEGEAKMLNALLIILVEHGMVSHVVAARMLFHCAPPRCWWRRCRRTAKTRTSTRWRMP